MNQSFPPKAVRVWPMRTPMGGLAAIWVQAEPWELLQMS